MGEPIGRISPVPPVPSLLTSARNLPAVDWLRGIFWPTGCAPSHSKEFCPADPTLDLSVDRSLAGTMPFTIYTPVVCDVTTVHLSDLEPFAREMTEAHTAFWLARALWMGDGLPNVAEPVHNTLPPTLRRSALELNQAAPVSLDDGVAALLAEYEQATGGQGGATVHFPSVMAPFALGGNNGGARVCWPEGNLYRGALGSVFVPGPGYPLGATPDGPDGAGPLTAAGPPEQYEGNSASEVWVYVTGPVEYAVSPVVALPEEEKARIPFRTNRYEVWGERSAIVRFDPCAAFAVLVENPVPPTEVS